MSVQISAYIEDDISIKQMVPADIVLHKVTSGQQMFDVVDGAIDNQDIAIFAAAAKRTTVITSEI